MAATIDLFLCRSDNFGALIHDSITGRTAAIDAPEAAPIEAALARRGWKLSDILVTHHHEDHVAGIAALKAAWNCRVVAAKADAHRIPAVDETVAEGDRVAVGSLEAEVIDTPGHTVGHIAYWFRAESALFAADTLFSLGCGRVFEGTPGEMWTSLQKLRALPDETLLYCGHEYTLSNARFALTVDPENAALRTRAAEVERQRAEGRFTLPVTLGAEKRENPFLRADDPGLAAGLGMAGADPVAVFAEIRERKNRF
ncbi:hydroxyacylglutathione hydrolase [Labrys wisconsinensis]|uniref:Hydroxyacylglutathione hydrolase n=1 Tax=Labrys wisconsinensis TaxID=425677 RepID=A0ABU0JK75_9HYPH|nr:hydroxyacylglutathione hydrolase [Labrys wisconsinensis]MDQ0474696.1 hydroxyacylglutathione hydrolase [Labrys wisconsinensis]